MPFTKMLAWLKEERELGVELPECAVLATADSDGIPHSRVVAIREIEEDSLLFFTQKGTRKVGELLNNPFATMNFLLSLQQRQIILEGRAEPISQEENKKFWETLPRERQIRFSSYASSSGQVIQDLNLLESKKNELLTRYENSSVPMNEFYFGFRFKPETFIFYTLRKIEFSEVIKYSKEGAKWQKKLLSP